MAFKNHFRNFTCICAIVLSACASSNVPVPSARPVIPLNLKDITSKDPNIIISRIKAAPHLQAARVKIDDIEVGRLKNGQYIELYITPGKREIDVSYSPIFMQVGYAISLIVRDGQSYHYNIENQTRAAASILGAATTSQDVILKSRRMSSMKQPLDECCTKIALKFP